MRYGDHQARFAEALAWLVTHDVEPPRSDLPVVLACRAAVLAALQERAERAVRGADVHQAMLGLRRRGRDLVGLHSQGPVVMTELIKEHPRGHAYTIALTDAMLLDDPTPETRAWIDAARHATLATEILVSAPGWPDEARKAWQVVADIADTAEAITVLDKTLLGHTDSGLPRDVASRSGILRLTAHHVGSMARSGDLDPSTDELAREERHLRPYQVTRMEHLADGLRATEQMMRQCTPSIRDLRSFALMQSDIAHACAGLVTDSILSSLRQSFYLRELRFRELAAATVRVASVGTNGGRALLAQTHAIGQVVVAARHSHRQGHMGALAECDVVYPKLVGTLAERVHHAFRSGQYLVVDEDSITLRWRRSQPEGVSGLAKSVAGPRRRDAEMPGDLNFLAHRFSMGDRTAARRETGQRRWQERGRRMWSDDTTAGDTGLPAEPARRALRQALDRQPLPRPFMPNRQRSVVGSSHE